MTTGALLFAFILSTLYGAGFHLWQGGSARRLLLYLLASWMGFALGHVAGEVFKITMWSAGPLHILPASLGSGIALFAARWLARRETQN
ncbi:MAG: hypothetical protein FJ030_03420 [Chloroflexi bacterium]|nr:hypothetical protein [Chloroflexota bacterium]